MATTSFLRAASTLLAFTLAGPAAQAADVTFERLLKADDEPQNWLMASKNYAATRYSSLDQINAANVKNLKLAFTVGLSGSEPGGAPVRWPTSAMEATPLVEDGFMYVTNGWDVVYKLDLRTGDSARIVWKTDPGVDKSTVEMPVNRGVGLYKDMVIVVTGNGHVLGLKSENGRILFDEEVATAPKETFTAAPQIVKDTAIVAASGGDYGGRGWVGAFDLVNRKMLWRWYPVPAPGEPGHETWPEGDGWKSGGGAMWMTGAYDPATNRLIWGTGNPAPMFDRAARPGDNLYTNSSVALDADTGKLAWYFQYTPNDAFDYDEVGAHMLLTATIGGQSRQVLSHWGRNGFYYNLDAKTGQFLNAGQYATRLTWTRGLDPKTGKPVEYDPAKKLQTYNPETDPKRGEAPVTACPESHGGVNYWPPAYSPLTRLTYAGTIEGCFELTVAPDMLNGGSVHIVQPVTGSLTSLDPATATVKDRFASDAPNWSGAVATAGHLVFTAFLDGTVIALDDRTLKPLYSFHTGTYIAAPPIVYAVNGREYVAILGGGPASPRIQGPKAKIDLSSIEPTPMLFVFSL